MYFTRMHATGPMLTSDELREMINFNRYMLDSLKVLARKIHGSFEFWFKTRCKLEALAKTLGMPTFFSSVSSADHHWPELRSWYGVPNDASLATAIRDYPAKAATFFRVRMEKIYKEKFLKQLKVYIFFYL